MTTSAMTQAEILAFIADMPSDVLAHLGINENGQRVTNDLLHPTPADRAVLEVVVAQRMTTSNLVARLTGLSSSQTSRALTYLVDHGLVNTEGVARGRMYLSVDGVNASTELPEVKAKARGRKAKSDTESVTVLTTSKAAAAPAPKKKAKKPAKKAA